jgi:hypothetical protein
MPDGNFFTNAKHFWDSQSLFGKHLLGVILCFILLPIVIVLGKLGLKDLSMALGLVEGVLAFWAFGHWYVVKGAWRLLNIII